MQNEKLAFTLSDKAHTLGDMDIVRGATLNGFKEMASGLGLDCASLLRRSGLPANAFESSFADEYVSRVAIERLYDIAEQESQQPYLAARLGSQQDGEGLLGVLGMMVERCDTVGEALNGIKDHFSYQMKDAYLELEIVDNHLVIEFIVQDSGRSQSSRHTIGFGLSSAVAILGTLCGPGWRPAYVQVMHDVDGSGHALEQYLLCDVHFTQDRNALAIKQSDLQLAISSANPQLNKVLHAHLASLGAEATDSKVVQVKKLIRQGLKSGRHDIGRVARILGVHRRTLHRILQKEGETYSGLLSIVRKDLAAQMLLQTETDLTTIADILAYSDLSAFSRAFKAWYKVSPQQFRLRGPVELN